MLLKQRREAGDADFGEAAIVTGRRSLREDGGPEMVEAADRPGDERGRLIGNEDRRGAVLQHVGQLFRLDRGIDRNENTSGAQGAEDRQDRFDAVLEVENDTIPAPGSQGDKPCGHGIDGRVHLPVGEAGLTADQAGLLGKALSAIREKPINLQPERLALRVSWPRTG